MPGIIARELCYFKHYCLATDCKDCQSHGRYYLADRHFIRASGIPRAYAPADFDPTETILSNRDLKRYASSLQVLVGNGSGAYFWSEGSGTGKTSVACLLMLKYLANNMVSASIEELDTPVLYLNTVEFLDKLRSSMSRFDEAFDNLWRTQFTNRAPQLLLLDDIGAEKPSDWVRERLYSLINYRWSNGLATIYTSNLSPEKIKDVVGTRVHSRIFCQKNLIVRFDGSDRRIINGR